MMAIDLNIKCFVLAVFLSSMFENSVGVCPTNFKNYVLREGDTLSVPLEQTGLMGIDICVGSEYKNIRKKFTSKGNPSNPDFDKIFSIDQSSMTVHNASVEPGDNMYSSSAIVMLQYEDCNVNFKLAVVKQGPICTCNVPNQALKKPTLFTCFIEFTDVFQCQMNPYFIWTVRGTEVKREIPIPKRTSQYVFQANSTYSDTQLIDRYVDGWNQVKCQVAFNTPPGAPVPHVVQVAPAFSADCNFNKGCI